LGYPVDDRAGYVDGEPYSFRLRERRRNGDPFVVREYQRMAAESFFGSDAMPGGSGVVVLPCGAGKTVVGIQVMAMMQMQTLILATNITAARQWRQELLDKTDIPEQDIGVFGRYVVLEVIHHGSRGGYKTTAVCFRREAFYGVAEPTGASVSRGQSTDSYETSEVEGAKNRPRTTLVAEVIE
jgi:hypothetical protein